MAGQDKRTDLKNRDFGLRLSVFQRGACTTSAVRPCSRLAPVENSVYEFAVVLE